MGVCGGNCAGDVNDNGLCDDEEIGGCTDPMNPGFDPNATFDDGSCLIGGCLIVEACNYDETADYQLPGACEFESCAGCTDSMACNYDMDANVEGLRATACQGHDERWLSCSIGICF